MDPRYIVVAEEQMNKNTSVIENEIQAFVIERAMRPGLTDLFSYKSRATKRLLRILMRLAETVAESKLVGEEAITLEVWFACIAPVSQGYWRSAISERTKKIVLDEFYGHAFNIIINDILIPSSQFKSAGPAEQDLLLQAMHADVRKNFERRANEYVDAIVDCMNKRTPLPMKLTKTIARNFVGASGNNSREMEIMAEVTFPIIEAFGKAMRG